MKVYYLEIGYDEDTDEVEYITEEIEEDVRTFFVDNMDMKEYWDKDCIELSKYMFDIGIT